MYVFLYFSLFFCFSVFPPFISVNVGFTIANEYICIAVILSSQQIIIFYPME